MRFKLKNIADIRKSLKLNQKEAGAFIDVDQSNYGRRENGLVPFTIDELEKLAASFRVDLLVFFDGHKETSRVEVEADSLQGEFAEMEKLKAEYNKLMGRYEELEKRYYELFQVRPGKLNDMTGSGR